MNETSDGDGASNSDDGFVAGGLFPAGRSLEDPELFEVVPDASDDPVTAKLALCQDILDYRFRDPELLQSALTHASGASHRLASNERLEFLGDAVLGLTVCQWLFETYPQYDEGELTKIKSAIVSRRSCGQIACRLGLDRCLIVGRGVTKNQSFPKSLVSDVFESVIAALYLDGGLEAVKFRIRDWLSDDVVRVVQKKGAGNFKSSLQQIGQRDFSSTPQYRLVDQRGPDHRKSFQVAAIVGPREFASAWGSNKKDAEQRAAANALAELNGEPPPYHDGGPDCPDDSSSRPTDADREPDGKADPV